MTTQDKLTDLAGKAARANGHLLRLGDYLRNVSLPDSVAAHLPAARESIASLWRGLEALGADNPHAEEERRAREVFGLAPLPETPLHLLSSEAAQRFARAMWEAAEACKAMEAERGIVDGLTEQLTDYADIYEMEVFGPAGLGEGGEKNL